MMSKYKHIDIVKVVVSDKGSPSSLEEQSHSLVSDLYVPTSLAKDELAVGVETILQTCHKGCLPKGYNENELIAVVVVLLMTIVICYSTKHSSWVNMSLTALHIMFIAFVIAMGFWRGKLINFTEPSDPKNAGGFFPFRASGVFNGAAMVYMSYIGYGVINHGGGGGESREEHSDRSDGVDDNGDSIILLDGCNDVDASAIRFDRCGSAIFGGV
ncbi:hypothetical protein SASPL_108906 [Salvia splendens]|uniref:Uncharacterized protein n=1 Tax=Salvia splendens TaxID=180675 RepID=A0A8X8YJN7_SALSN|nr:hypothetical protein SASPL_108906 [Salvia splendens]